MSLIDVRSVIEIIFLCFVVFVYGVAYGKIRFGRLQPTCSQLATDCISRQAAIDDVETVNPSMLLDVNWVKNWVKSLPSAQSEIIRCRDCKHRGEKPIADGRYWCELHDTFMYYCSDAERRTDEPN